MTAPADQSGGQRSFLERALSIIERGGNALPHPATLFAIMAGVVIVVSDLAARAGLQAIHPGTGKLVTPVSLLTVSGLHRILTEMVTNFTGFAPLGTVLVAMLGIAVAEGSGFIGAALRLIVLSAPARLLTFAIVFAGVMSNTGGEVGYVLLVPLAAVIFAAVGRHPIAGLAAAFAGVSGGYSATRCSGPSIRCSPACPRRPHGSWTPRTRSTRPATTTSCSSPPSSCRPPAPSSPNASWSRDWVRGRAAAWSRSPR
jgi:p-aminobenzoyl-glutamate transporter AbgT